MLGLTLGWLRLCSFRFKESFPTLLPGALTILNTETWLVGLLCMEDPEKKKVCWEETLALVWLLVPSTVPASTGCFPQSVFNILFSYVSVINLFQLFGPLSFSQIKAKWFYLMYISCVYDLVYMCIRCFIYLGLLPIPAVLLLLHPNLSPQNCSMTTLWGKSFCSFA